MSFLEIIKPDDWHVHFREGELLKLLVPETSKIYNRAIVMPNLIKPIQTEKSAVLYKNEILKYSGNNKKFFPLMTLYLSEFIKIEELLNGFKNKNIFAAKLYPAGATTNSSKGVKDIEKIYPILEKMSEIKMPLLIHGEVNDKSVDVFDREKVFVENILDKIYHYFPNLKITLEHITTKFSVDYVKSKKSNLKASITPHHLILNRTDMLEHKIKPHYYCLPILKKEEDRKALLDVAINGDDNFFLGTDSAPHNITEKENECGCAGVFNTIHSLEILAQIFDNNKKIHNLEKFVSLNGSKHYSLNKNIEKITLKKISEPLKFNKLLQSKNYNIKIFKPPFQVYWNIVND